MLEFIEKHLKKLVALLLIIGLISFLNIKSYIKKNSLDYIKIDLDTITKGKIEKIVTATGNIKPLDLIEVGTQVSGIIEKIYVDYNDEVKENQLLARLETDILEKDLSGKNSELRKARTDLELATLNTTRTKKLYQKNYIAKIELDEAEAKLKNLKESYNIAQAYYYKAKKNLSYAYITSPVTGIIISRDIDEGQTVAASLQTPTLFQIAKNLKRMKIETSISESDISMIKIDQEVLFKVDAYKNKFFKGIIKQIRLNPVSEQNVIIYNVIIEIDNNEGILLPGMTAYVSITIDSLDDIFRISNTTFRFKTDEKLRKLMKISEESEKIFDTPLKANEAIVFKMNDNKIIEPILVEKLLSDIKYTAVKSDQLEVGDEVISAYLGANNHLNNKKK